MDVLYSQFTRTFMYVGARVRGVSDCMGDMPVSTKVDRSMLDFLNAEAERCGVTRSELIRRVLDDYRDSRADQLECPECETVLHIDPNNATDA